MSSCGLLRPFYSIYFVIGYCGIMSYKREQVIQPNRTHVETRVLPKAY